MTIDGDMALKILTFAVAVGSGLYAWVTRQSKENSHEVAALRTEVGQLASRVAKIEGELTHLPDKDTVHKISLGMSEMRAQITAQGEAIKAVNRTMERVESFLLDLQARPPQPRTARK